MKWKILTRVGTGIYPYNTSTAITISFGTFVPDVITYFGREYSAGTYYVGFLFDTHNYASYKNNFYWKMSQIPTSYTLGKIQFGSDSTTVNNTYVKKSSDGTSISYYSSRSEAEGSDYGLNNQVYFNQSTITYFFIGIKW